MSALSGSWWSAPSFLVLIAITLVSACFLKLIRKGCGAKNLPKGSLGLPVIGESLSFLKAQADDRGIEWINERVSKYGQMFKTSLMGTPTVVITGLAGNKFILGADENVLAGKQQKTVSEIAGKNNVFELTGARYKLVKAAIVSFLKPERLQLYVRGMEELVKTQLAKEFRDQEIVKIVPSMKKLTFEVSCSILFGIQDEPTKEALFKDFNIAFKGVWSIPINFPGTLFWRGLQARSRIINRMLPIFRNRKEEISKGILSPTSDVISCMLSLRSENQQPLTEEEIMDNFISLMIASHDTSAILLTLIVWKLARDPDVFQKVSEEQLSILRGIEETGGKLSWSDIQKMKYTWRVAQELMRIIPPAFGSFRTAVKDTSFGGYDIPKGWLVFLSAGVTHMSNDIFKDPTVFDPSRFENPSKPVPPFAYIPFGGGVHLCIGNEFARVETLIVVHHLVTKFEWSQVNPNEQITRQPLPYPSTLSLPFLLQLMAISQSLRIICASPDAVDISTKGAKLGFAIPLKRRYKATMGYLPRPVCSALVSRTGTGPEVPSVERSLTKTPTTGKYGRYGGKFVPETLMSYLNKLEAEFNSVLQDDEFQTELAATLRDYVGRETPLYLAERLTEYYKDKNGEGPEIYLKREDLNHTGAHKINNAVGQAMLAKRMGRTRVVAATGAGQHGVAAAAACTRLGLQCTIFMGKQDMEKQPSNVLSMKQLGSQVKVVDGSFKDATSEAIREWVGNLETSYYLTGTMVGPHPSPNIVREFQSVIGKETRRQAMEKWGCKPDVLVACIGTGSNAMGLFHEFIGDTDVKLIGVEAAGSGLDSGRHSATLARGEVGVYHGAMSYLLQDEEGQIVGPHSIGTGLEYPGVGPELSFLKDTGRAEFYTVTDQEAVDAFRRLCRLEGIFPALEASHALAFLERLCPTLPDGAKVVINCSGRGDKDIATIAKFDSNAHLGFDYLDLMTLAHKNCTE